MTRVLDLEVTDAIWAAIEPLLPPPDDSHRLGWHNPRVPDKVCFGGILIRLVTGSSWEDIEAIMDFVVSDTTLRTRRNEWVDAGVFDRLAAEALAAYDRILGLDLEHVAIDGSLHKAPRGGEGTGKALLIGPNSPGSGPWPPTRTASRSAGPSTAQTATTSNCWTRPSTRSPPPSPRRDRHPLTRSGL